ncbi:lipase/acyltransferase domain-containing protein [Streptomyces sp. NPDC002845]
MSVLVGVHGIGKQQRGRHQLLASWSAAVADGLERSCGSQVSIPDLDIAFYGDLVSPVITGTKGTAAAPIGALSGPRDGLHALAEDELADLEEVLGEVVGAEEVAAVRQEPLKGLTCVPRSLQWLLGAVERRFSATAAVLLVGEFRQVRRYLSDPVVKARVDERVRQTVRDDCRVLIGHSLGSVVALEFLRQNDDHKVESFLTVGSPLSLRMVRAALVGLGSGPQSGWGLPPGVSAWVNVRDVRDPVACGGDLGRWWTGVEDRHVVNQGDAHAAERYLGKREAGEAILTTVPGLAW